MRTDTIDAHLRALAAVLPGPARARASLLGEARDGLVDAATAYQAAGMPADEAEARAVADFGTVRELAAEYRGELALSQGRRTLLVTLGAQLGVWLCSEVSWRLGRDELWAGTTPSESYRMLARVVDAAQLVPACAAVLAVALAFTWGQRFFARADLLARMSGMFGLGVAGLMLASCAVMSVATPGLATVGSVAGSLLLSAVPAGLIAMSARRCLVAARPC